MSYMTMDTKEIVHILLQIEKLQKEGHYEDISSLLADLDSSTVTLEQLQTTDIAKTVYYVLKSCPATTVKRKAKGLLSKWKRLYGSTHEHKDTRQINEHKTNDDGTPKVCESVSARKHLSTNVKSEEDLGLTVDVNQASGSSSSKDARELTTSMNEISKAVDLPPKSHNGDEESTSETYVVSPQHRSSTDSTALRLKCVELLLQALTTTDKADHENSSQISTLAQSIEKHIHDLHSQSQVKYKSCIRSKLANLKNPKNLHLRQGLLTGTLTPEVFARMSVEEMANEELRRLREEYTSAAISEHQLPQRPEGSTTTKVRCRRCQGMDCRVTQISSGTLFLPSWVRNGTADDNAMTFMTCAGCGEQWYHSRWVCL